MATMRTQEVAVLLNRSVEQVRRYVASGELHATHGAHNKKSLLFNRDEVVAFAKNHGIYPQQETVTGLTSEQLDILQHEVITPEAHAAMGMALASFENAKSAIQMLLGQQKEGSASHPLAMRQ